ncbi:MAG: hypothetical protein ACRCWG_13060 [Sarcina sp.]
MEEFMIETLEEIWESFEFNITFYNKFCLLHGGKFNEKNIPDYSNEIIEEHYLLKYLPAYLLEYNEIYNKILDCEFFGDKLNILSLGCGTGIDFWGAYYAIENRVVDIEYTGVDCCRWKYYKEVEGKCKFIEANIGNITNLSNRHNVIIFPKSIGEFTNKDFNHLVKLVKDNDFKDKIIVIAISLRKANIEYDEKRFNNLIEKLIECKYKIIKETKIFYNENEYGRYDSLKWHYKIPYPTKIRDKVLSFHENCQEYKNNGNKYCSDECKQIIGRSPITTVSQTVYKFIFLERK